MDKEQVYATLRANDFELAEPISYPKVYERTRDGVKMQIRVWKWPCFCGYSINGIRQEGNIHDIEHLREIIK